MTAQPDVIEAPAPPEAPTTTPDDPRETNPLTADELDRLASILENYSEEPACQMRDCTHPVPVTHCIHSACGQSLLLCYPCAQERAGTILLDLNGVRVIWCGACRIRIHLDWDIQPI